MEGATETKLRIGVSSTEDLTETESGVETCQLNENYATNAGSARRAVGLDNKETCQSTEDQARKTESARQAVVVKAEPRELDEEITTSTREVIAIETEFEHQTQDLVTGAANARESLELARQPVEDCAISAENIPKALVFDEHDKLFAPGVSHVIRCENQGGSAAGHYIKCYKGVVSATARYGDKNARFKIYVALTKLKRPQPGGISAAEVVILECASSPGEVIAIKHDRVVVKTPFTAPSSVHKIPDILKKDADILFFRFPRSRGSQYCNFQLYSDQENSARKQYLGFDENGAALVPSQVDKERNEAIFLVH